MKKPAGMMIFHPTGHTTLSVRAAVEAAVSQLAAQGLDQPRLAAELLIAGILDCPRLELPLHARDPLAPEQAQRLEAHVRRAAAMEPIQYILGTADFMGCILRADRRALVPRPETEFLVDCVLACEDLWKRPHPLVADVGTGSGCIAIALARNRPAALYVGIDLSQDALALARENAALAGVAHLVRWQKGDLLEAVAPGTLDAVVANLPYIPAADLAALPQNVRGFEPRAALDGGPDGLAVISRLVERAPKALKSGGWIFIECAPDQAARVKERLEANGFTRAEVRKDFAGRDRVVLGVRR
ncbi:MAG: peptide chain release factor N(5)-glutamine methyltransferase [Kiritimatiellae bacterium]|nr:peptide chain release factor N(5)-glutamine methyltransferase [Kiritimatiellia bacterium]